MTTWTSMEKGKHNHRLSTLPGSLQGKRIIKRQKKPSYVILVFTPNIEMAGGTRIN